MTCVWSPLRVGRPRQPEPPDASACVAPLARSSSTAAELANASALLSPVTRMDLKVSAVPNDIVLITGCEADVRLTMAAAAGEARPTMSESPPGERSIATGAPLTAIGAWYDRPLSDSTATI